MTELISIESFTKHLFDLMQSSDVGEINGGLSLGKRNSFWNSNSAWFEILKIIEYHVPFVVEKFSSTDMTRTVQEATCNVQNSEKSENNNSEDTKKRKREADGSDFSNTNGESKPNGKRRIIEHLGDDTSLRYTTRVIMRSLLITMRYLAVSLRVSGMVPATIFQSNSHSTSSEKTLSTTQFGLDDRMKYHNCVKAIEIVSYFLQNNSIRLFVFMNKLEEKELWESFRSELHSRMIPILRFVKMKTKDQRAKIEKSLFDLWSVFNQFVIFVLTLDKTSVYHAIEFKEFQHTRISKTLQSTLSEKTCFVTSLLIEDEISTRVITRTNLKSSFKRFDTLRILKDRSFVNYYFDILFNAMENIHDFHGTPVDDARASFIFMEKGHKMLIRKSILLAKFPLLIKMWNEEYKEGKDFFDPFLSLASVRSINENLASDELERLSDIKYNSIEKALFMISKFPRLCNKTNQYLLGEIINSCLFLDLVSEKSIRELIPQYTREDDQAQLLEQSRFAQFIDNDQIISYVAQMVKFPRLQSPLIIADLIESKEHSIVKIDFIIRNPSFLDIIQLHGYIPEVLEKVFETMGNLFQTVESPNSEYHKNVQAEFALAFSVLYIIAERFEIKKTKENREVFYDLMNKYFVNEAPLISLRDWFLNMFEDRLVDPNSEEIAQIGDEVLRELLSIQSQSLNLNGEGFNMDGVASIRSKYSPAHLLKVCPYIAKQCLLWYKAKPEDLETRIAPILSLFIEQFGYHIEIGIAYGMQTNIFLLFDKTNSTEACDKVLRLLEEVYNNLRKIDKNGPNFGFNISSVILHNIFVQCIHTHKQNVKALDKRTIPSIYDYNSETIQYLLQEVYLITGKNIEWQVVPIPSEEIENTVIPTTVLVPYSEYFGNTNINLSSSSYSVIVQTIVQHEFDNIYRSLAIGSPTSLNTIGKMKSSMWDSFNILKKGHRSMGSLNFLKFMLDQIFECLLKEEQEPFEALRVTEAASIMFSITCGDEGTTTMLEQACSKMGLFESILQHHSEQHKNFLEAGNLIYAKPSANRSVSTIQGLSNVEYMFMLSSLHAYFTVFTLALREKTSKTDELVHKFILRLIDEHYEKVVHDEKHFMTYYIITFLEHASKVPELLKHIFIALKGCKNCFKKFADILKLTRKEIAQSFVISFVSNSSSTDKGILSCIKALTIDEK